MLQMSLHTPIGALTLTQEEDAIVAVDVGWSSSQSVTELLCRARDQLHDYFDGTLTRFTLPMAPAGSSPYRDRVWRALADIPYGETRTYAQLAQAAGGSARSIGQANRCNPLPILIPCHRVVASSHVGGFSMEGGLQIKRMLLSLETRHSPPSRADA